MDGELAGPGQEVIGSSPLFRTVPLSLLCSRVSNLASIPNKSSLVWAINYIVALLPRGLWGQAEGRWEWRQSGRAASGEMSGRAGSGVVCEIGS